MAYIPSARVLKEGGYEADSSQIYYGMPGKWSPSIEDLIITKVKQLAGASGELPKPAGAADAEGGTGDIPARSDGFKVELVASEPDVVDPVAMCFDEKGRLFVCEMRGYPNGGVGTGNETRGRIKCLDRHATATASSRPSTIFAEGLRFPMGITPYKDGLLVAVAPDLLYLEDTDGDGKADKTTVLYTGFNLANIQQMVNGLQWGLDNWVYGSAGSDGGTVQSPQKPDAPPVSLRNRGFRFKPDVPGSLEPTSGGGQYGLAADDYQRWFTATNSQHLRQIVLPDHYLRRNPYLPVSAVTHRHSRARRGREGVSHLALRAVARRTHDPQGRGAGLRVAFPDHRTGPRRVHHLRVQPAHLHRPTCFRRSIYGNNFVCDPGEQPDPPRNPEGERGGLHGRCARYPDREFLASTDNWFRPVHLSIGPDGAIYVLDFYREVIETPLSLPDDIKKQLNLESRGRGRIWRIAPTDFKPSQAAGLQRS